MALRPDRPGDLLLVDGRPVASVEVADGRRARARGLIGRDHLEGALLLAPAGSVHTVAMRFPIDAALCTADLEVIAVVTLGPRRLTRPRRRVRAVIEAEAGSLRRWGVVPGARLAIGRQRSDQAGPDAG